MANQEFNVTGIVELAVADNVPIAKISFATPNKPFVCTFDINALSIVLRDLTDVYQSILARTHAKTGHVEIVALEAVGVTASPHAGGGKVLLCIRTVAAQYFALSPAQSKDLRRQMQESEEAARIAAAQTRQ